MTGPYQRAIEHLARIFGAPELLYAGAFETVVATFPVYLPTEIAADVMKQRRLIAETRSPIIIDPALFVDLARHDKEKQHGQR